MKTQKTTKRTELVNGVIYNIWSDIILRATFAEANGEVKILRSSGYLSSTNSIKKAIKLMFL